MISQENFLTTRQLAEKLHRSVDSVRRLARKNKIACVIEGGKILFPESGVEQYLCRRYFEAKEHE